MMFRLPISNKNEQCVLVSFLDDNDLITKGNRAKIKMQEIINIHETLHAVIEGKIKVMKTKFYVWKWKLR